MNRHDHRRAAKHRRLCCIGHWPGTHLPSGFERWMKAPRGFVMSGTLFVESVGKVVDYHVVVKPTRESSGRWVRADRPLEAKAVANDEDDALEIWTREMKR